MKLINTDAARAAMAPFETIEQLNANTKVIRDQYAHELSTSAKSVLDVIHRYSSKFYGVCYLSKSSIAEMVGVTRRQVIRICNRLQELGIIAQYDTDRRGGRGRTSNTIVFLTQIMAREDFLGVSTEVSDNMQSEVDDTANVTGDVTGLEAPNNALGDLKNLKITRDTDAREALIKNGLLSKLPKTIKHVLSPFFDADKIYELAGIIYKAKSSVDRTIMIEDYESEYYSSILSVINGYHRGQVKSLPAVLYSAVASVTRSIWLSERKDTRLSMYGI